MKFHGLALGIALPTLASHAAAMRVDHAPRPAIEDQVKDRFVPAPYDRQRIGGLLGERLQATLERSLLRTNLDELLAGFRKRPGADPGWGENAGKFLRAASSFWLYWGDERLKTMLDRLAQGLIGAQSPDGYCGAYTDGPRWTGGDVGAHGSSLAGLLTYYLATGDQGALRSARKIGDLLTRAFGRGDIRRDLLRSGAEGGMAGASLLEPVCLLYRYSGERRNVAGYLLGNSGQAGGTRLVNTLIETGSLTGVSDSKASDLLLSLVGLVELHRLSGEEQYLQPVLTAWRDIVAKRLYVTGTTSSGRQFRQDHVLPGEESARVGEACATVNWLLLNWHLLRLTGEARYADELERTVYNHLLAAQDAREGTVSAFAALVGKKRPEQRLTCCTASHYQGMALIPQMVWGSREGAPAVVLYAPGEATVPVGGNGGGLEVNLTSETKFPLDGAVTLTLRPPRPVRFPLWLRVPSWCRRYTASVNGAALSGQPGTFLRIDRVWQPGDKVHIDLEMTVQVLPGGASYPNHAALQRGPQVLALEASANPAVHLLHRAAAASLDGIRLSDATRRLPKGWPGAQAYGVAGLAVKAAGQDRQVVSRTELVLVPFADARNYRVWLARPERMPIGPVPVTAFAAESWSRVGNLGGSICDERLDTFRVTYDGAPAREDWYAVELENPALIGRVVYRHGRVFPNGGWFNTISGKPAIQVRRTRGAEWETVATLDGYPETSANGAPRLTDGQAFEVRLKQPVTAVAVRILGRPGGAFSSCAELGAYQP